MALRDALLAVGRPFVEVHLTDPSKREPFRHVNFLADIAIASVVGRGAKGYSTRWTSWHDTSRRQP